MNIDRSKKFIALLLLLFFTGCQQAPVSNTPPAIIPTQELPSLTPALPTPSLTPTPFPATVTPMPIERLAFTVATDTNGMYPDTIVAFANSDGSAFETPGLFEPFRWTGGVTGKYILWSPDGLYLAFDGADKLTGCGNAASDCFIPNYGTYLVDLSQGTIIQHVEGTTTNPAWSPDSRSLALSIDQSGQAGQDEHWGDLFVLDLKSGRRTQLTGDASNDLYPAWSPDGHWIAFLRYMPRTGSCGPFPATDPSGDCDNVSLYVIRPDGSDLRLLAEPIHVEAPVDGRHRPYNAPSWSPDSRQLAIMVERDGVPAIINQEIALVDLETGNLHRLTENDALDIMPVWSPDGRRLAFVSDRDGSEDIFTMNADGTSPLNLTRSPGLDYAPAWSPSGNYIAFVSSRGIYTMSAEGLNPTRINGNYYIGLTRPSWRPGL